MTETLILTKPSADELWQLAHANYAVTMSGTLRNEIAAGLPQPGTVPPVIPPVIPPATTGPAFPASVPGYSRIITDVWDMSADYGKNLPSLTPSDLIIIAAKVVGPAGGSGTCSIAAYPGNIPQQIRKTALNTAGGTFMPTVDCRQGQDQGIQYVIGPGQPNLIVGMTVGTWYYFTIASLTGPPCDMRISLNRPR